MVVADGGGRIKKKYQQTWNICLTQEAPTLPPQPENANAHQNPSKFRVHHRTQGWLKQIAGPPGVIKLGARCQVSQRSLRVQGQLYSGLALVDFDELGNPLELPPRLSNLPLHPDKGGWYSVLGSLNYDSGDSEIANEANNVNPQNNIAIPIAPVNPARNAHPGPPNIFCQYHKCSGNSGPHTCASGRFTCNAPNCSWTRTFKTKQAFNRHYRAMHLNDRVDCPVQGCVHVGARGIKRADNLAPHLLNKHGIARARLLFGN
ncbi:hypothetical protein HOY80DRAFT_1137987 [Tuber brumale]|nr:hypothetical protein HOY80DRAFT_1137987 [Tuber brumale]